MLPIFPYSIRSSPARPTRNYAYLVFDTLYGLDTEWKARPQMVDAHEVDEDGLGWTLRLRDGLRFHDNVPVARDVGSRAVFARFDQYQLSSGGQVGFTSGLKVAQFDRVEWLTLDSFSLCGAEAIRARPTRAATKCFAR